MSNVCEHGRLKRKCDTCFYREEYTQLENRVQEVIEKYKVVRDDYTEDEFSPFYRGAAYICNYIIQDLKELVSDGEETDDTRNTTKPE